MSKHAEIFGAFLSVIHINLFLERFQSKALRIIVDAPWYVPNTVIRRDLQIPTVKALNTVLASAHIQMT
jgi:hypothetical protein